MKQGALQHQRGVTLVELVITMAVMAILIGIGAPSMIDAIQTSRMSRDYNESLGAFHIARSEAVKSSENVVICARAGTSESSCSTDWNNGLIVFLDRAPIQIDDGAASIGEEDEVIHVVEASHTNHELSAIASTDNTAATAESVSWYRYQPNGRTNWSNGTLQICDSKRGATFSRGINVVLTGDVRRARTTADSDIPLDTYGRAICQSGEGS